MGLFDKLCWFGAGVALGYFICTHDMCNEKPKYRLINDSPHTYIRDNVSGQTRQLYDGLKLGTVEERVNDIFLTDRQDMDELQHAVLRAQRRYGLFEDK